MVNRAGLQPARSDLKDQLLESLHYGSLQIGAVYRIRTGGFLLDRQALSPLS